ncbi:MAG: Hpt domain-containing protein [Pseudomonadota bacterium]
MSHLDKNVFDTLKSIMEDEFEKLIDVFIQDTKRHITLLQDALTHKDSEVLRASAHAIKGSSSNIGASQLSRIAADLECQVKFELSNFKSYKALVVSLSREFEQLVPELREACGK